MTRSWEPTDSEIARRILADLRDSALREPRDALTVAHIHVLLGVIEELRKLKEAVEDLTAEVHRITDSRPPT